MSKQYPIIAVTGSSGAGTTSVQAAFEDIFHDLALSAAFVGGDSFHAFKRDEMRIALKKAILSNKNLSHFGPEGNLFKKLESLFKSYSETGTGFSRAYLHSQEKAALYPGLKAGEFTPWEKLPDDTDLLFYEGLHGGVVTENINVLQYVDLLIGVVPIVNLEWIQKIHRDKANRGYSTEASIDTIVRRMQDYIHYITPQFANTHINFQRVPTVDTSNPFMTRDIPALDESFVVIHFKEPHRFGVNFPYLLKMIQNSFMSRSDTLVVPGGKMMLAIKIILKPIIQEILETKKRHYGIQKTQQY